VKQPASLLALSLSLLLCLIGLAEAIGGFMLLQEDGSPFFVVIGAGTIVSGALAAPRPFLAAGVYGLVVAVTAAWSFAEVGGDPAQLAPRVLLPAVLWGLVMLRAVTRFRGNRYARSLGSRENGR